MQRADGVQVGGGCERQSGKAVNAQRGLEGGEGQSWEGALPLPACPLLPSGCSLGSPVGCHLPTTPSCLPKPSKG